MYSNSMTVAQLSDHFEQRELGRDNTWRSYATEKSYHTYLKRWIVPHWGEYGLFQITTVEVESWLRRLPLAKSSCAKINREREPPLANGSERSLIPAHFASPNMVAVVFLRGVRAPAGE
jgi:hypothetical protein